MPQSEINPYSSPVCIEALEVDPRKIALNRLRGPSLGLLLLSVPWGIGGSIVVIVLLFLYAASYILPIERNHLDSMHSALAFFPSAYVAWGAWCMRRGVRYKTALAASIIACIPLASPCLYVGIPFGIWAIVVLRRPDVRAAFGSTK